MALNEQDFRAITFQGVTFPATLMGIDVLMHLADENFGEDSDLAEWLFRLCVCKGSTKLAPAERCARCAQQAIDLMLEHRQRVLDEIQDRLVPHGCEVETTYQDWILALQRIVELSNATDGDCFWSAPLHPEDPPYSPEDALKQLRIFEGYRDQLLEDERNKRQPGNDPATGEDK